MATMHKVLGDYQARKSFHETTSLANRFAQGIVWIEGEYFPLADAKIPFIDQGFLRGDLTYDVPAVWDGRFFRLNDHLERLSASCIKMRMKLPLSKSEIKRTLCDMVAKSGAKDAFVELIVTRGLQRVSNTIGPAGGGAPVPPESLKNTLYMFVMPYVWVMSPEMQLSGSGTAIITRNVRRTPPGAFDPTVKNLQWGDLTRGILEAYDRGAHFPFLTDGDGNLAEGSGFNVCVIKNGVLYTPDRGVLEGVTRKTVLEVAKNVGMEVRLEVVPVQVAYEADEIFMCTTAGGVMPVTKLDGEKVGDGRVGVWTGKIWDGYWKLHWDENLSFEVEYGGAQGREKARL